MNDDLEFDDTELPAPDLPENTDTFVKNLLTKQDPDQHKLRVLWVKYKKEQEDAIKRRRHAQQKIKYWMRKAQTEDRIITDADAKIFDLEGQIFKK